MTALTYQERALVAENLGLAHYAADTYLAAHPQHQQLRDDLVHEAVLGLCRAAQKWTAGGASFATYSRFWTETFVREHARRVSNPVRAPQSKSSLNVSAMWIQRGDMPVLEEGAPSGTEDEIDGKRLWARARAELERAVGFKNTAIYFATAHWEHGDPSPSSSQVPAVAGAYGVSQQRIRDIRNHCRKRLMVWAATVRGEAA